MKNKKNLIFCLLLLICSFVYIILVKTVDVRAIGPNNSSVGFGMINGYFAKLIGSNMKVYKFTEILGYLTLLVVFCYGLYGLITWIKRKKVSKVDREILLLGALFIAVLCLYVFFEVCIINYRPLLIDGILEASFPSSHTILALCVCGGSLLVNKKLFKDIKYIKYINVFLIVLMISVLLGRILSGVHWISDIVGGILISIAFLKIFKTIIFWK